MMPPPSALSWLRVVHPEPPARLGELHIPPGWRVAGDDPRATLRAFTGHLVGPEGEVDEDDATHAVLKAWQLWEAAGGLERGELQLPDGWQLATHGAGAYLFTGPATAPGYFAELEAHDLPTALRVIWQEHTKAQAAAAERRARQVAGAAALVGLIVILILAMFGVAEREATLASPFVTVRLCVLCPLAVGLCLVLREARR